MKPTEVWAAAPTVRPAQGSAQRGYAARTWLDDNDSRRHGIRLWSMDRDSGRRLGGGGRGRRGRLWQLGVSSIWKGRGRVVRARPKVLSRPGSLSRWPQSLNATFLISRRELAGFMAVVAVFVSERVLGRLQEAQTRHLSALATIYLDGLGLAVADAVVRGDVWDNPKLQTNLGQHSQASGRTGSCAGPVLQGEGVHASGLSGRTNAAGRQSRRPASHRLS